MKRRTPLVLTVGAAHLWMAGAALAQPCASCDTDTSDTKCENLPKWEAAVDPEGKEGWEALMEKYVYEPDRRPGFIVILGSGPIDATHNPHGITQFWLDCDDDGYLRVPGENPCYAYPVANGDTSYGAYSCNGRNDALDHLIWQLDGALEAGFRRIMLQYPAGMSFNTPGNPPFVPSSAWWALPDWKRDALEDVTVGLAAWIAENKAWYNYPDLEMSVYLTLALDASTPSPCVTQFTGSPANPRAPDYTDPADMLVLLYDFKPWIDIGFDRIWCDIASGPNWYGGCNVGPTDASVLKSISVQMSADYDTEVLFGYESWPLDCPPCDLAMPTPGPGDYDGQALDPDDANSLRGAFIQTSDLFICGGPFDPLGTWPSDWTTMAGDIEYNLMLLATPPSSEPCTTWMEDARSLAAVAEYRKHGIYTWYIPQMISVQADYAEYLEILERVYDFGTVNCIADFNLDGSVTSADMALFTNNWLQYDGCGQTFWEGDVNGDGTINSTDISFYYTEYFSGCNNLYLGGSLALDAPCP